MTDNSNGNALELDDLTEHLWQRFLAAGTADNMRALESYVLSGEARDLPGNPSVDDVRAALQRMRTRHSLIW